MDLANLPTNLETITLNEQTNYRLIKIGKIKDYFESEVRDPEILVKKLSKYITCFSYTNQILTVLLTVFGGTYIYAHFKTKKRLTGLIASIFSLIISLFFGITQKLLYETKKREKRHNKLLYLAKNKLDCVEMLASQAVIDQIVSHGGEGDGGKISEEMLV